MNHGTKQSSAFCLAVKLEMALFVPVPDDDFDNSLLEDIVNIEP